MSAAGGGNKKTSSQSDKNYWARAKLSNYAETHKARSRKRTEKRAGKNLPASAFSVPDFPRLSKPWEKTRVYDSSVVAEGNLVRMQLYPIYQLIDRGVILDSSFNRPVKSQPHQLVIRQHPLGRREIVS